MTRDGRVKILDVGLAKLARLEATSENAAKTYFEEPVRKDPGFALVYSGLADSYLYLALFRQLSPELACQSAKEAL